MNANLFNIVHELAEFDGDFDLLIVRDENGEDIAEIAVEPSEDREPYAAALAAAGFVAVGDNQARRA